jgi:hypothetical protein
MAARGREETMVLTAEQEMKFRGLCEEIKPGEYGRVTVSFVGSPSNLVQITGEKNYRFQREKETASKMGRSK